MTDVIDIKSKKPVEPRPQTKKKEEAKVLTPKPSLDVINKDLIETRHLVARIAWLADHPEESKKPLEDIANSLETVINKLSEIIGD
jgi:hypothetical protein